MKNDILNKLIKENVIILKYKNKGEFKMECKEVCLEAIDEKILCSEYFNKVENREANAEIACHRLYDLYYIIVGAQQSISKAEDKNIDISEWDCNEDENLKNSLRIFFRGEYIKHAILNFNSISDYTLQIVWSILGLYEENTDNIDDERKRKHLEDKMKNVKWERLKSEIKLENQALYDLMDDYYKNTRKLRCSYANIIKHNYNFRWRGIPKSTTIGVSSLKYIEPMLEDVDDVVTYCKEVNTIAVKYIHDIYNFVAEKYGLTKINQF